MDCFTAREAVSAMLDGEDPGTDRDLVQAHLAACAACREWQDAAHEVTRRARLQIARPGPPRTDETLTAVRASARVRRRPPPAAGARFALAAVAAGQLALTVPSLLLGHDHSLPVHVAHEMGSFDAALAVGFLVAAWRPGRALGMRAMVGAAAMLLVTTAAVDLVTGQTNLAEEAPHLLAVAGWLLLRHLAAVSPPTADGPGSSLATVVATRLRLRPPSRPRHLAQLTASAASATGRADLTTSYDGEQAGQDSVPAACG
jgi:predicted anti-sigma-YlaC factor YlaD